jgi:tetratricopeptide (TPR) repeat protein
LAIREANLGPLHVDVAKNVDRLGELYVNEKKFPEAAQCLERSVIIWMKAAGSEGGELTSKYQKLAEIYAALNRPVDAEPLVLQVLTTRESETVTSLNTLASIYIARDNLLEAEPLYRLSIAILDKKGILNGRRISMVPLDATIELLADTAIDYVELLKKLRRKSEASRLEAKVRAMVGKNYMTKKQHQS